MLRCLVYSSRRPSIHHRLTQQQKQHRFSKTPKGNQDIQTFSVSSSSSTESRQCWSKDDDGRPQRALFSTRTSRAPNSHHPLTGITTNSSLLQQTPTQQIQHHTYHRNQTRTKVFVSRHNQSLNVTAPTILDYCNNHGIPTHNVRTTTTHVVLEECPFCTKPTGGKSDNLFKLYIQIGGGAYFCHRCGTNGSWYDFKAQVGGYQVATGLSPPSPSTTPLAQQQQGSYRNMTASGGAATAPRRSSTGAGGSGGGVIPGGATSTTACLPMPQGKLSACYSSALLDKDEEDNSVLQYLLETRGLTRTTLRKYGVGRATYNFPTKEGRYQPAECVTFPWIMRGSDVAYQEELRGASFPVSEDDDDEKDGHSKPSPFPKPSRKGRKPASRKTKAADKGSTKDNDSTSSVPSPNPLYNPTGKFVTRRIKVRAVTEKSWQRLDPPGGGWGLFGLHTVPDDATEIVLTEGEYDAMAVWQATGIPAVSLPNGCRSLPVQVLPLLERFDKVYLWMDNDAPGQEGAEKFAKKIGMDRSYLVKCTTTGDSETTAKDANEALLKGLDLGRMLQDARPVPHDRIMTFSDLRGDVLDEMLHPDRYTGVPMPSLPNFTKIIKGFRRGELTVLTGPTGSGKTTFLGQASLDLAEQGINCLWGSFEIKNTRLVHKLLKQFARGPILPTLEDGSPQTAESVDKLEALADRFEGLPLYFMRFHGGSEVEDVLDAMEYAVYVNDVEHIILDNLQFMISRISSGRGSTFDKFDVQDVAIEKFRKFSTEHNVHITLVVHPRKEDETSKLNMSSFYGSAKATQEADTVAILQHDGRRKYIEVKKNRFDGTLGYTPLHFHRESGRYVEDEQGAPDSGGGGGGGGPSSPTFSAPKSFKPKPKHFMSPPPQPEKEIEGLEDFWNNCLAPKRA